MKHSNSAVYTKPFYLIIEYTEIVYFFSVRIPDPDPHQNQMDPKHCKTHTSVCRVR